MLTLTYEYKIEPTIEQVAAIERYLEVCRKAWNYALRERKDWLNSRKSDLNACSLICEYIIPADAPFPNYNLQAKSLAEARKNNPELKSVNAQVLQQVLRKLETAFLDMSRKGMGFPRFKKPWRMRSFVFPQFKTNPVNGESIKLPELGWVKMRLSRPIPDGFTLKQVRIVKKASGYFAMLSLQCDVQIPDVMPGGHPIGIDLGLENFLATSDGELIARPRFFDSLHRKLKLLQRRLKHKKKGSKNWRKLNLKIARLHQRIHDTRKDFHFKLAHHLVQDAGMIFVEDINFRTWAKGMLGKHTLDAGFGQFVNILQWVCWKEQVYFAKVDADYTSQQCPRCQTHTGKKDLSVRIHNCHECGYTTHRDVAAAQVVMIRGFAVSVQPHGVGATGQAVPEIAWLDVLSGVIDLDKCPRTRKSLKRFKESSTNTK
ncbi:RNA-guided endonuclease InsQ/TnpB family protein [Coleofasciculus sp.]|uniref:RNA-guided endonuclease InsQ/TnpB family protein n=1 Tax=Coleofasciculus sp. TaxID=3100458 RepID=UPI0039F8515F